MEPVYHQEDGLVLTSGGQDSTTCLYWAGKNFRSIQAISFKYGQKHAVEVDAAKSICRDIGVPLKILDISFIAELVHSNLFEGMPDVNLPHKSQNNVPSSYVPYRNLLFLTLASAWAGTLGIHHVVTGICETDYSGYADCRDVFVKSLQATLNLATDFDDNNIVIHTPLMWLNKAETFRMAEELDCLEIVLEKTMTCYNGVKKMNDYGMGCGRCPACTLRKAGFHAYLEKYKK